MHNHKTSSESAASGNAKEPTSPHTNGNSRLTPRHDQNHQTPTTGLGLRPNGTPLRRAEPPIYCSWKEVEDSRTCSSLQQFFPLESARGRYGRAARSCPKCGTHASRLSWVYVATSEYSWNVHQGRAGWMTICDRCQCQVDFFIEIMN